MILSRILKKRSKKRNKELVRALLGLEKRENEIPDDNYTCHTYRIS